MPDASPATTPTPAPDDPARREPDAVTERDDARDAAAPVDPAADEPPGPPDAAVDDHPDDDPDGTVTRVPFWRAAVRPRSLVLLLVLLAATLVCGRLGTWQLDRAQVHGAAQAERRQQELVAAPPVPLTDVLAPQTAFSGDLIGRKVSVTGTFDAAGQLLVAGRAHDGRPGSLVLTPLRTADGAVLPVVRGWVARDADADAPPQGAVDVVGYLQVSEEAGSGIAGGRTDAISSAELLNVWQGPIWTGYLVLSSSDPAQASSLALLDPPRRPGSGLNVQNLAYAVQWWVFGLFCAALWVRLVRDEAADDPRPGQAAGGPPPPEAGAGPEGSGRADGARA
ncbi:SURF1 family protein [Cellulomonas massiliensis]|uniref:SURF1 family protein n=1 Tax=Cellulomonas massiliensis TaxID=1465811 RepID=UPI00037E6443|nr:SURF1 family protein [Cellulomonas massiliensis]